VNEPCPTCGRWRDPVLEWLSKQELPSKYVAVTRVPPFRIIDHDDDIDALVERTDIPSTYYHQRT
jgi:hypothetical protein